MSEWVIVTVIIALVGLIATIAKPIVTLTKSITSLTVQVEGLREDMREQKTEVHASFTKVWDHEEVQDEQLNNHETRLSVLEAHSK